MSDKSVEPPFVTPHHFSDIDVWKVPDRNFYVFIALSFIFGFFGLDHFYIRSFGTAMQKFGFNIATLGMWYIWDIVQIVSDSKKVRDEGLTSPFDWIRGIGRGVFTNPMQKNAQQVYSKKDLVLYALMTLFGLFGMDKFYLGDTWQGFGKLLANFNPFFFFGWMWVIWDIVTVFFYPESIIKNGINIPPVFDMIFSKIPAADLFIPKEGTNPDSSVLGGFFPGLGGTPPPLPELPTVPTEAIKMSVLPMQILTLPSPPPMPSPVDLGTNISGLITGTNVSGLTAGTNVSGQANGPNVSGQTNGPNVSGAGNSEKQELVKMSGGGITETISVGPIIAGTITAISIAGTMKLLSDLL